MSLLQGFKVLDLASVGPAARASRILADYGMEVIKVAPVAKVKLDSAEKKSLPEQPAAAPQASSTNLDDGARL